MSLLKANALPEDARAKNAPIRYRNVFFISISSNLYEVSSKSFAFSLQPYKAISMPERMIFNLLILLE
jgi:hypothetical protein